MKLIIHGGFFSESNTNLEVKKAKQEALKEIAELGYKHLAGHTALETVVYTVQLLEDCVTTYQSIRQPTSYGV